MRENSIKLGLMPPLTGLVEMYGAEITRAGQIACDEVNESGGVLGRPLELVIEDDGSLPESAVAAATRLVDQHRCTAIIGNLLSNSRIAVAYRVAEPRRIPYLNFSFYEGSILSRYFFHFAALPNQQIDRMIPYMRNRFGSRMFFAGNNYEWPRGSIDAAKRALEQSGGQVAGEMYYPIGVEDKDLEDLLDRVAESGADVFVPYFAGADQIRLLTRFSERGLKNRMAVVMGHYDEVMASRLPPEVREGFYSSNTYFMTLDTPENKAFLARLAARPGVSGIWPQGDGILTNFGEGTYLCVKAFAKAANLAGSLDPEALVEALETIAVTGPQGVVQMDQATHHAQVNTCLSRCEADGSFAIIERFGGPIPPALPERYRHLQIGKQPSQEDIYLQSRMMEQITEAVLLVHAMDGAIVYANPGAERMFGYASGGLENIHFSELFAPSGKSPGELTAAIGKTLSQSGIWRGETENITADGKRFWCAASISAFTHPQYGEAWMILNKNITERRRAEDGRKETLNLLQNIIDSSHDLIFVKDLELRSLLCNKAFARAVGKQPSDMYGKTDIENGWLPELVQGNPAKGIRGFEQDDRDALNGKIVRNQNDPANVGSVIRIFDTIKLPLRDLQGSIIGVLGIARDITERKQAESALSESRALLKTIIDTAPMRIFWKDRESRYLGCNPAFARDAGESSPQDIIGKDDFQLGWKEQADLYRVDDRQVMDSGIPKLSYEEPQTTPDGKTIWLRTSKIPLRSAANEAIGLLGIYEDITERKQAEQLLQSEQELKAQRAAAQKFSAHLQSVREEEKAAIAREIHDNLGSTLTALKMKTFQLLISQK